jgi:hypothetical protein
MMLKQTMLTEEKNAQLVTSGESINLGTFQSLVHGQDIKREMSFSIKYDSNHDAADYKFEHSYNMLFANKDIRKIGFKFKSVKNSSFAYLENYSFQCRDKSIEKVRFELNAPTTSAKSILYKLSDAESLKK